MTDEHPWGEPDDDYEETFVDGQFFGDWSEEDKATVESLPIDPKHNN